ncbi:hypothetical protein [Streptomyces uncialis]|uniref:hypothetical protein n=1 Tax=Streptomyces uncialis TaxID=1048205 RepID=UPI003402DB64
MGRFFATGIDLMRSCFGLGLLALGGGIWLMLSAGSDIAPVGGALVSLGLVSTATAGGLHRQIRSEPERRALATADDGGPPPVSVYGELPHAVGSVRERYGTPSGEPGELVRSFAVRRSWGAPGCLGAASLAVASVLVLVTGGAAWWQGFLSGVGVLVAVVVGRRLHLRLTPPPGGALVYQVRAQGLVVEEGPNRLHVPWDEVLAVRHQTSTTAVHVTGTAEYPAWCELTLARAEERLAISTELAGFEELVGLIVDRTHEHVLSGLVGTFERAGALRLGGLTLSRAGIQDERGFFLPWSSGWHLSDDHNDPRRICVRSRPGPLRLRAPVPERRIAKALIEHLSRSLTRTPEQARAAAEEQQRGAPHGGAGNCAHPGTTRPGTTTSR